MKITRQRIVNTIFILSFPFFIQGCTAVALTAVGLVAGVGIDHSLSGIAYKTFTLPADELQVATMKTLKKMDMEITKQKRTKNGWEIEALAVNRSISIELEELSANTTRMRVVANQNELFFRDSATATEIIVQTADTLDQDHYRG